MKLDLNSRLEKLQKQPYDVRVKILWAVVAASALILLGIWILSLKHTFSNLDGKSLIQAPATAAGQTSAETQTQYVAVERVEKTANTLKIYFNLTNPTNDILNVSKLAEITLNSNGKDFTPQQLLDRQGQPFVQKVLSHTQNFGTLTFGAGTGSSGKLTFDQMFLEGSPDNLFKQTLNLDFNKLNDTTKVRN